MAGYVIRPLVPLPARGRITCRDHPEQAIYRVPIPAHGVNEVAPCQGVERAAREFQCDTGQTHHRVRLEIDAVVQAGQPEGVGGVAVKVK